MRYKDYLATFTQSKDAILADWEWIVEAEHELIFISLVGDAFLKDPVMGGIFWLDTMNGEYTQIATSLDDFETEADDPEKLTEWFLYELPELIRKMNEVEPDAIDVGVPGSDECYHFSHPPILGGELDPANMEVSSILVHFTFMGQIHEQAKDLPPGTEFSDIELELDRPKKWWQFWR